MTRSMRMALVLTACGLFAQFAWLAVCDGPAHAQGAPPRGSSPYDLSPEHDETFDSSLPEESGSASPFVAELDQRFDTMGDALSDEPPSTHARGSAAADGETRGTDGLSSRRSRRARSVATGKSLLHAGSRSAPATAFAENSGGFDPFAEAPARTAVASRRTGVRKVVYETDELETRESAGPDLQSVATPRLARSSVPREHREPLIPPREPSHHAASAAPADANVQLQWLAPSEVNRDQQAVCRLLVKNQGDGRAEQVEVRVELPAGAVFQFAEPEAAVIEQRLTWDLGPLDGGETRSLEIAFTPTTEGAVTPRASVTVTQATSAEIRILEAQLELEITAPAQCSVGERTPVRFVVTNRGSGAAVNVFVHARLGEGLQHANGARVRYGIGTLGAGETRSLELPIAGLEPGSWQIDGAVVAGESVLARADHTMAVVRPQLEVAVEGPGFRYVDRKASYVIAVHNPGPAPADNVRVAQDVPEAFRFLQASAGGSYDTDDRTVEWYIGRLEADQTVRVAVDLLPQAPGDHPLRFAAQADASDPAETELATRVEGVVTLALEIREADDPIEVAGQTRFEIRVTNRGSIAAEEVEVGAIVPLEMQIEAAQGPTTEHIEAQQIEFDPLPRLGVGESQVYYVDVTCIEPGQTCFKALVRSASDDEPLTEEELTRVYAD